MGDRKRKQPAKPTPRPDTKWVECPECGYEQEDMGRAVRCEACGYGPMPTAGDR
jgi:ribosomal protein S27E